jgi:N-acetylglucosaminyldiphosphoundecaprenol N-acetyl-beta-D-mannosaminyltransferase
MKLFGIDLKNLAKRDPERALLSLLSFDKPSQVVTLNPEMALAAKSDKRLREAISDSTLILADGTGIVAFTHAARLTGADALELLVTEAAARNLRVLFLGGAPGEAQAAADVMVHRHPGLIVAADGAGDVRETESGWQQDDALLERIRTFQPTVLAVAFGHGKQEKWIHDHLPGLPSVRVAIGVGGTFAYLSGRIPRAPGWMRAIGLEWVWRLVREPARIGRIFQAVVVFPISAVWDIISPVKSV